MNYPPQNTDNLQEIINNKAENIEYARWIPPEYRLPYIAEENPLFYHQKVFLNFMKTYDKIIAIHEPGTGKTCSAIAVAEYLKYSEKPPKKVYILERGKSVLIDVRNQILNNCAPGAYEPNDIAPTSRGYQQQLTKNLSKYYTFSTYKELTAVSMTTQAIKDTYSDCMFILDEAHNLNNASVDMESQASTASTTRTTLESEDYTSNDINHVYKELWKIFHEAYRTKVIIMSATPMMNSWREIARLLNLVLPRSRQLNVKTFTLNDLKVASKGLISYVSKPTTNINMKYVGDRIMINGKPAILRDGTETQTILTRLPMKGVQAKAYKDLGDVSEFYIKHDQISTFVFPDGSFGGTPGNTSSGLYKYIKFQNNSDMIISKQFLSAIKEDLGNLSSKFEYCIKKEIDPPGRDKRLPGRGCSFFFFTYIPSQALPFAACLEANGFERYTASQDPFKSHGRTSKILIPKKPRYILVTGDNVDKLNAFRNLYNHPDNCNGEYVQIIIGTKVIRDGVNLFNVVRMYINPGWNESSMKQAIMRSYRSGGHDALLESMIKHGIDPKITIETHLLSAYLPSDNYIISPKNGIDDYVYAYIIESKSSEITNGMKILKESSIDLLVHKNYQVIPESKNIDWSTYDSTKICSYIKDIIINIFSKLNTRDTLKKTVPYVMSIIKQSLPPIYSEMSDRFTYLALYDIISNKRSIPNIVGNTWLNLSGNDIVLVFAYPKNRTISLANQYYSRMILNEKKDIDKEIDEHFKEIMLNIDIENPNVSARARRVVICESISKHIRNNTPIADSVMKFENTLWFKFPEPISELESTAELLSYPSALKGRKPASHSKTKLKDKTYELKDTDQPLIYIYYNTLNSGDDIFFIRTRDPKHAAWIKPRKFEEYVFMEMINLLKGREPTDDIPEGSYYGIIKFNGNFILNTKTKDIGKNKKKGECRGTICATLLKSKLIKVLMDSGISAPDVPTKELSDMIGEMTNKDIPKEIFLDKPISFVEYYYKWSDIKKVDICKTIREYLESKNLLVYEQS